jgi:hypothetical protein
MLPSPPKVGDHVYVDVIDVHFGMYLRGGRATVCRVTNDNSRAVVAVEEVPGTEWYWDELAPIQDELRDAYGDASAGEVAWRPL